jgi:hypothetical protein
MSPSTLFNEIAVGSLVGQTLREVKVRKKYGDTVLVDLYFDAGVAQIQPMGDSNSGEPAELDIYCYEERYEE